MFFLLPLFTIQLLVLLALVAVSQAGVIPSAGYYGSPFAFHAPTFAVAKPLITVAKPVAIAKPVVVAKPAEPEPFDPNPSYSFHYEVKDATTGDDKSQTESLENGAINGMYSLVDPDGFRRTVEYTADDVNGFNAIVNREPIAVAVAKPVVAIAKPVLTVAKPLVYHAPWASAPVAHAPWATAAVSHAPWA
ncbi:larval cuticle protein A2B-like [Ischnura elegans]|uniref:larval cuticle protein A2B-like n=1 Tax=Ischnura elegans TaxID=197161 RepID=UPI001ED89F68|nr:larval cuticle protein A2B-like [Ischnura elegans]